jgi:hypothetical protein
MSQAALKPSILVQLDTDAQASVFDSVVAIDAGVDWLLRHQNVRVEDVRDLVYGAIFTRGVEDLKRTAIFVGGSDVAAGEAILEEVSKTFFGPMRVSVMMDSNGANTTAAAAVLAAGTHVPLSGATALVLASTGPVGQRVVRLLARQGAQVRAASRSLPRAQGVCEAVAAKVESASLSAHGLSTPEETAAVAEGAQIVIAAGAPGIELMSAAIRRNCPALQVAIDLNAVQPAGLEGVEPTDRAAERDGTTCYGAIGVGGAKMKIHKAAVRQLFESNDQVLDAEEIFRIGQTLPTGAK